MCRLGNLDNISWIVHHQRHHSVENVFVREMHDRETMARKGQVEVLFCKGGRGVVDETEKNGFFDSQRTMIKHVRS